MESKLLLLEKMRDVSLSMLEDFKKGNLERLHFYLKERDKLIGSIGSIASEPSICEHTSKALDLIKEILRIDEEIKELVQEQIQTLTREAVQMRQEVEILQRFRSIMAGDASQPRFLDRKS